MIVRWYLKIKNNLKQIYQPLNMISMKHYNQRDYQSPMTDVFEVQNGGVLCTSAAFGTAKADDFTFGDDISDIF